MTGSAATVDQASWRVSCACGWTSYRKRQGKPCPRCCGPVARDWISGQAPSRTAHVTYLAHIAPRYRHAAHYLGKASKLVERTFEHLTGAGSLLLRWRSRPAPR
jgi:hypothetical protein